MGLRLWWAVGRAGFARYGAYRGATVGVTVLLTTHDLADIERLCARVLILDHGKVLYDGGRPSWPPASEAAAP